MLCAWTFLIVQFLRKSEKIAVTPKQPDPLMNRSIELNNNYLKASCAVSESWCSFTSLAPKPYNLVRQVTTANGILWTVVIGTSVIFKI